MHVVEFLKCQILSESKILDNLLCQLSDQEKAAIVQLFPVQKSIHDLCHG